MGGGGGCCVGDCCVANCGFCCIGDFFSCSDSGCCVGNCSDSGGRGSDTHATKIANELAQMREKAKKEAKKQEQEIIKEINDSMSEFLNWLEGINSRKVGGRALSINIDRVKKLNKDMEDDVVGFIGRRLDDRLVATDSQVSVILAEPDDAKRKKNFDDFYDRIKHDAIRELIKEVESAVDRQSDSIEREIQLRMNEVQSSMKDELNALEELKEAQKSQKSEIFKKQAEYMYYEDLCDIMDENLKRARES